MTFDEVLDLELHTEGLNSVEFFLSEDCRAQVILALTANMPVRVKHLGMDLRVKVKTVSADDDKIKVTGDLVISKGDTVIIHPEEEDPEWLLNGQPPN